MKKEGRNLRLLFKGVEIEIDHFNDLVELRKLSDQQFLAKTAMTDIKKN